MKPDVQGSSRCRHSVVREGHETGLPIIRAMWLHYPSDRIAVARGDQYLWGRDILVAPVTPRSHCTKTARPSIMSGGDWMGMEMHWTERARRLDLRLTAGAKMRPPNPRRLRLRVAGSRNVRNAMFTGMPLQVRL